MKILFVTDNFPPEVSAPANRSWAHCKRWVQAGEDVTVVASAPNYPAGKVYEGYSNELYHRSVIEGVKLIRVWSFIAANEGFLARVFDFLSFAVTSFFAGLFVKTDIIITTSPQFFVGLSARALAFVKRKPWIFEVRDLWPESIAAVGMMRKGFVYRMLEVLELHFYRSAAAVIIVSEAFRTNLTSRGIDGAKIFTIPNGAELADFQPRPRDPAFASLHGLEGKFVVGFIGTHGLAHALDFILDCAPSLAADNVQFLFVGEGAKKTDLVMRTRNENLTNVTFLDRVPREAIPNLMGQCDAALVNLKAAETFLSVIPSKIFEAAALRSPMLIGVDGIAREIVEQYGAGLYYAPENRDAFIASVRKMKSDAALYARMQDGCSALAHAYDRDVLAAQALDVVRNAAKNRR